MKWIYNKMLISSNEILFYVFLGMMLVIIIFAFVVAIKKVKHVDK